MGVCIIWLLEFLCLFSTLMIVNTSVNTCREPNVKNTTQSSIYLPEYPSGKAVDGCKIQIFDSNNCCSHTQEGQKEAWWQVDLEELIMMEHVKIYYREWSMETSGEHVPCNSTATEELANKLSAFYCEAKPQNVEKRAKQMLARQAEEYHKNTLKKY
ncbi:uncharacterized protein LOC110460291 [Mizuhopecten yessoensis]|uniref:uncharacterized protein LOC110460291 n=1 Tax=Mizuhopecten yessoensis TaxID=6573 RepID=UPI000B45EB3C|nr:uncharacterized protein LOC110460291 [Mizuhopecten yessoensis]